MAQTGRSQYAQMRSGALHQMVPIARFHQHEEAQAAVDLLGEKDFPVAGLSIVGTDLRQVEHILGKVTYGRLALSGAITGILYGVMLALLMSGFTQDTVGQSLMTSVPLGMAFFIIANVAGFSRRGRATGVNTVNQLVAGTYELLCVPQEAPRARALLSGDASGPALVQRPGPDGQQADGQRQGGQPAGGAVPPAGSSRAPQAGPDAGTDAVTPAEQARRQQSRDYQDLPDGRPRYGVRADDGNRSADVAPPAGSARAGASTGTSAPAESAENQDRD